MVFYNGIVNSGIEMDEESQQHFKVNMILYVIQSVKQDGEIKGLTEDFRNNKIDFMPLKGTVIRKLYPDMAMRHMCDSDLLIKPKQYDKIKKIMSDRGYDFVLESDHEFVWSKKDILNVELHKYLIPSYYNDYFKYYGDGWNVAIPENDSKYRMSDEDFFVFNIVHFAKHYRASGIGIKGMLDVYMMIHNIKEIDQEYIKKELSKFGLVKFYENVLKTIDVWFNGAEEDAATNKITDWVFSSGEYGTMEKVIVSRALKKTGGENGNITRRQTFFSMIFLPYSSMCIKYSFLKKLPFLLPVMWVYRIVKSIIFKFDRLKKLKVNVGKITDESMKKYRRELNDVGLDV
ncbi:MAG: nucleotidyltransferase family protein [Clostridia bacterium]|nr:nucleotidyltransferase family protein [Clostridia bacterium]